MALIYVRQSTYREESISPEFQVKQYLAHCRCEGYRVVDEPTRDYFTAELGKVETAQSDTSLFIQPLSAKQISIHRSLH
jgi:hypothetical protein